MPNEDAHVEKSRIHTRRYAKQIQQQNVEMKRTASKPAWVYPRTPVETVIPRLKDNKTTKEWNDLKSGNRLNFHTSLHFAVDRINLRTVRKVPGQQNLSFIKRAQFLIT